MNWHTHTRLLVVALVALAALAPAAAAVDSSVDAPSDAEVGTEFQATFDLTKLYDDGTDSWTLNGTTELEGASWTVKKHTLDGDVVSESYSAASFDTTVRANENVERVEVTVRGTVPEVTNYTYDPAHTFVAGNLSKVAGESRSVVVAERVHHYTAESQEARSAIDDARAVVADADNSEADSQLSRAVNAFDNGNFDLASDLAADAEQSANQSQESAERTQMMLYVGLGVLALGVVFGGVAYWRSQQDTYDKLR